MRGFSALCGSFTVTVVYALLIEMKFSLSVAILGTSFIAFGNSLSFVEIHILIDNALLTLSRFILLDPQLICYSVMACFCWVKFRSFTKRPFSVPWWVWLFATGSCIGLTIGVKFVGFFIAVSIGVCACFDLWDVMNPKKTKRDVIYDLF
jgi:dolichyl-phosphate-mannose-protein mannosyltransferase